MKNGKNFGILTKSKVVPPGMTGDAISIPTKTRFTMPKPQYGQINLNKKRQNPDHRLPQESRINHSLKSHKLGDKIQIFSN